MPFENETTLAWYNSKVGEGKCDPVVLKYWLTRRFMSLARVQIPDCPEKAVSLAQLLRDGTSGVDQGGSADETDVPRFELRRRRGDSKQLTPSRQSLPSADVEFGVTPFFVRCGPRRALGASSPALDFSVQAPTTSKNLHRVLRALQVREP